MKTFRTKTLLVLVCTLGLSDGWRTRASTRQSAVDLASIKRAPAQSFNQDEDRRPSRHSMLKSLKSLKLLLLAFHPAAAFNPSRLGPFRPASSPLRARRHWQPRLIECPFLNEKLTDAGNVAARWCVDNNHENATVAVSAAVSTAELLRDFWKMTQIFAPQATAEGKELALAFPMYAEEGLQDPEYFQRIIDHIDSCGDVSTYIGMGMIAMGRHPRGIIKGEQNGPMPMIILHAQRPIELLPDSFATEDLASNDVILDQTRRWVEGVIVKMRVCPFSVTADKAGIPIGGVRYPFCNEPTAEAVYEAYWQQVATMAATTEEELATVLLITPRFSHGTAGGFDVLADTLNSALGLLGFQRDIQLVFFHPRYVFRDGKARKDENAAANFARRSPYPMVNLLRTPQVRAAQRGIPTSAVYNTNEKNLEEVGREDLTEMLEEKNWTALFDGRKFHEWKEFIKISEERRGMAEQVYHAEQERDQQQGKVVG